MPMNLQTSNILDILPARTRRIAERQRRRGDLQAFFEIINDALDSLIERKDRAAEIKREEERTRQQQANTERTLGLAEQKFEFQKSQAAEEKATEFDEATRERMEREETEKMLRPLEEQYGQLSEQLISTDDPVQRNKIAVQMMNLESRVSRFGGQVKPVQDILKTQELLNPPKAEPENPELEALMDDIDQLSDASNIDPVTRMELDALKAKLRSGGDAAIDEVVQELKELRGGSGKPKTEGPSYFEPVDIERARKMLLDADGFGLNEEDIPATALIDPEVFRKTVVATMLSESKDVDVSQTYNEAESLLKKYGVPMDVTDDQSTFMRLMNRDLDADRPVPPPQELMRQAKAMFSPAELNALLATPEGRNALDETIGYLGAATAISRLMGMPLEQEAFGALAR